MSIATVAGPAAWSLCLAYNQLSIFVTTAGVNPVVYCDIYLRGNFYKTMMSNTPVNAATSQWQFDIQDAIQEFLRAGVPFNRTNYADLHNEGAAYLFVRVRGSSINAFGYLVPEGPVPVQGTVDTAPVAGGGTRWPTVTTDGIVVLNGALQLEQSQDVRSYLSNNQIQPGRIDNIYNLFQNPKMWVEETDWVNLPVLYDHGPIAGHPSNNAPYGLTIVGHYFRGLHAGQEMPFWLGTLQTLFTDTMYYLPAGPKNFEGLAPVYAPIPGTDQFPPWEDLDYYYIKLEIDNFDNSPYRWRSPNLWLKHVTDPNRKRFRFVNWLGHYEFINFEKFQEEFVTESTAWHKYNPGDFKDRGKEAFGHMRYNVRSNELFTATGCFIESDMWFVKQFLSTPIAYEECKGIDGQPDFMLPIVIQDVTIATRKQEERWYYEVVIQYEPANERINLRN